MASFPSVFDYQINVSLTALEIGTFFSIFLMGVATLQAWNYFSDFPEDPLYIKLMVAFVYGADLLHSAMLCHTTHHYTIGAFSNILNLLETVWSFEAALVVEVFIILVVQCYFGLRVQRVTRSTPIACTLWLLALLRAAFTLSITTLSIRNGILAVTDSPNFRWQAIIELSVGAFTDVGTAFALCMGLWKSRTGLEASNRVIDRVVAFTIGSGLLTSVISLCQLISYLTMSNNFVWIAFFSICSKMFTNSLLASLNQRGANRIALLNIQRGRGAGQYTGASTRITFRHADIHDLVDAEVPSSAIELDKVIAVGKDNLNSDNSNSQLATQERSEK